ncbi:MAG: FAD-dependent oxidoreductase [Beijerinckiaceae bacterium]|nr:FAD-dependent oxidoreductase [Beijerinckiaceae bacterium]
MKRSILIAGGGQAACQLAHSLRGEGHDGPIRLVGDEPLPPYQRPPLSKAYLLGKQDREGLFLRQPDWYRETGVDLVTGVRVTSLDRSARQVGLSDGSRRGYDTLVFATGTRPRRLAVPGAELDGVFYVRSLADADEIKARLGAVRSAVVIGGGFIGLEFAAVARRLGKTVTVLEGQSRLMARAVAPVVSEFFASVHRAEGVEIVFDAAVAAIRGSNGRVDAVETADGRSFPAQMVVVGIGVEANDEIASAAGLDCRGGIEVDAHLRTNDPDIYAIGDCVQHHNPFADMRMRIESVQNAVDQARCAAANIMGRDQTYAAVPWFWSDQYELKLQMVGFSLGHDRLVMRGSPETRQFSVFYYRGAKVIGIDSVNRAGDHMLGRKLIGSGASIPAEAAADEAINLKQFLA